MRAVVKLSPSEANYFSSEILLRSTRMEMPEALRNQILDLAQKWIHKLKHE